jgi:hypothetical protein
MQTHEDMNHNYKEFLKRLEKRAANMVRDKQSEITAGKEDENPLAVWKSHGIQCVHMPDDEQGILRISVGGGNEMPISFNYCTIRGGVGPCIALLERAIKALRNAPD